MGFLSGPQILRGHIFDTIAQNVCRTTDVQTFEKFCESNNFVIICNSKELIFDFYLNRKRNECWLAAYSCDLFFVLIHQTLL